MRFIKNRYSSQLLFVCKAIIRPGLLFQAKSQICKFSSSSMD